MITGLLVAALVSCDPALTALFTPPHPRLGRYNVCTRDEPVEEPLARASNGPDSPHYSPIQFLEALDAFGSGGTYDRAALVRLYRGQRVRVVRGWIERRDRFEAVTLLSPYPDASLMHLMPGTMVITWTLDTPLAR